MKYKYSDVRVPIDKNNLSIVRNEELCIKCGSCKNVCKFNVGVYDNYDLDQSKEAICIGCGQCTLVCPKKSITEVMDYKKVKEIMSSDKIKVFQIAPAVRASLGEEFGLDGVNVAGKIVSALRKLGADYVFDTTFGADLTIMEEANEFVKRIKENDFMPMFTSCCPAWVKYVEIFYPEFIPNLSTCKSPISMQGAIIKNYFSNVIGCKSDDIVSVAITPCTAKKSEIKRKEFNNDVDYVITTREFALWLKEENIDIKSLKSSKFDSLMATGTGAGVIFGNSGGVMEAAIRTVNNIMTKGNDVLEFEELRGFGNVKEKEVKIGNKKLKLAVINGTGDAKKILDKLKNNEVYYDFVEVMACEGGCIAGGGQPRVHYPITAELKNKRKDCLFELDDKSLIRNSYENPDILKVYNDYLGEVGSELSSKLLHTSYEDKSDLIREKVR